MEDKAHDIPADPASHRAWGSQIEKIRDQALCVDLSYFVHEHVDRVLCSQLPL